MKSIPSQELIPGSFSTEPVYLDEKYILISPDNPFTEGMLRRLETWGFTCVHTEGLINRDHAQEVAGENHPLVIPVNIMEFNSGEKEKLEWATGVFEKALNFMERYFLEYQKKGELQMEPLTDIVKDLIQALKDNRSTMLRVIGDDVADRNYLIVHSVKTTVVALAVGYFIKLPQHKLIELGIASFVHEIGMIRLPATLYLAPRGLTPQEMKAITAHPILGFNILKSASFPMNISSAVLEHHERMDGSGYPRAISGEKMSLYARIIAVCCSYEAMIASRPYREAKDSHTGILSLLRDGGNLYDEQMLRALVYSLSIFPLGSHVLLSNGARGIVMETNLNNPKLPVVKLLTGEEGLPFREPVLVRTEESGFSIVRMLTPEEVRTLHEAISSQSSD